MRRSNLPAPSTEGVLPYMVIAGFAVTFWGITMFLWSIVLNPEVMRNSPPPSIFWTLLAFLLPLIGYQALMRAAPTAESKFNLPAYIGMQIFALIVWVLSVWLWLRAYLMSTYVYDFTFVVIFLFQLLPYYFWIQSMAPLAGAGTANTSGRPSSLLDVEGWLRWMGKGEAYRGAMVLLAAVFWSMLYWTLSDAEVEFIVKFPLWGLLTIAMLTLIRMASKPVVPSGEVSAVGDPKSKAPGK